jgi:hypothetical protein
MEISWEKEEAKENLRLLSGRRRRKVNVPLSSPVSGPSVPSNCLMKEKSFNQSSEKVSNLTSTQHPSSLPSSVFHLARHPSVLPHR